MLKYKIRIMFYNSPNHFSLLTIATGPGKPEDVTRDYRYSICCMANR
jgi:hypothetical protein